MTALEFLKRSVRWLVDDPAFQQSGDAFWVHPSLMRETLWRRAADQLRESLSHAMEAADDEDETDQSEAASALRMLATVGPSTHARETTASAEAFMSAATVGAEAARALLATRRCSPDLQMALEDAIADYEHCLMLDYDAESEVESGLE